MESSQQDHTLVSLESKEYIKLITYYQINMRLSSITITLLLSTLSLATPNPSSNTQTLKRTNILKPLTAHTPITPGILARTPQDNNDDIVCADNQKRCGRACVNDDFDCCPENVSGGCPRDEECRQNDQGQWGCADDDDDDIFDWIGDGIDEIEDGFNEIGDEVEDGWDDLTDDEDAAGVLKPGIGVALAAAVVAAFIPL